MSTEALELLRRGMVPRLLTACFDHQVRFIEDGSRRKALFVARRSGKTWAVAVYLIMAALGEPATKCLYYGLTRESAWNTIYLHMLEPICRQFGIAVQVNLTLQTLTFENRSFIKVMGDDASDKQIDKALGGKYKVVVFDECQAINHDLESWTKHKLGPAMVDLDGTIVMAGTAGMYMGDRYWYRVTREAGREPGWSVHSWTPFDNPHMAEKVAAHLAKLKAEDADVESSPGYQQEWLCRWVVETDGRIYKYDPRKNGIQGHDFSSKLWRYVIGLDFGFEDDTAIVVGAYHPHEKQCFIVDSFKRPKMSIAETADHIRAYREKYTPNFLVGDCQNLPVIEELQHRYHLPIQKANKLGKEAHIASMNSDFRAGRISVVEPANRALIKEWDELVWDERRRLLGTFKENPTKDNHLADAALYLHHGSRHYRDTPAPEADPHPMRTQAERELRNELARRQGGFDVYDQLERVS